MPTSFLHPLLLYAGFWGGISHRYSRNVAPLLSTHNTFLMSMKYGEPTWRLPFWVDSFMLGTYILRVVFIERTVLIKWYDVDTYLPQSTSKEFIF